MHSPEVQEGVVDGVDEELRSARVGSASVGHGEGTGLVGVLGAAGLAELVGDRSLSVSSDLALAGDVVLGARCRAAGASHTTVGVLGVGAAELVHEVGDDTVEVEAVVEALLGEVDEVVGGHGHGVGVLQIDG